MLETMHFADELRSPKDVKAPSADIGQKEMNMARTLVESMKAKWEPDKWKDEYRECLMKVIEEKVKSGDKELPKPARKRADKAGKVIDLVALLQQSLGEAESATKGRKKQRRSRAVHHHARRKAA
jgi:DNA end-binding protein Ku